MEVSKENNDKVKELLQTMSGGEIKKQHPELAQAVDAVLSVKKPGAASGSRVDRPEF